MAAKYLIRLDDACDTSNLKKWNAVEDILDEFSIKPMVAVIPQNEDETLYYSEKNNNFWLKVKSWEEKGWSIAMHGFQHKYHYVEKKRLIFPFYDRSEFGGLPLEIQREKIKTSLSIFKENDIKPTLWIAPGHSFDEVTIEALRLEVPFNIISDGLSFTPYIYRGFKFIPQQLWSIKKKWFGIWTVCLHQDTMSEQDIINLRKKLSEIKNYGGFIKLEDIKKIDREKSLINKTYSNFFWVKYRFKAFLKLIGKRKYK